MGPGIGGSATILTPLLDSTPGTLFGQGYRPLEVGTVTIRSLARLLVKESQKHECDVVIGSDSDIQRVTRFRHTQTR